MIYRRRRPRITSVFKQSTGFFANGANPIVNLTFTAIPDPGDTIFITIRNNNAASLLSYPGFTVLGSSGTALWSLIRIAQEGETGVYNFTFSGATSNLTGHAMVTGSTLGYQNYSLTSGTGPTLSIPPLAITKNSTILLFVSTFGALGSATDSIITPSGYTVALASNNFIKSLYKEFPSATTEDVTYTLTPTPSTPVIRITRIEILNNN